MNQMTVKVLSVAGYILMVAGIVLLYFNHGLFSFSPFVTMFQAAAIGLMVWARITFKTRSFHFAANPTEGGLSQPDRTHTSGIRSTLRCLLFVWAAVQELVN